MKEGEENKPEGLEGGNGDGGNANQNEPKGGNAGTNNDGNGAGGSDAGGGGVDPGLKHAQDQLQYFESLGLSDSEEYKELKGLVDSFSGAGSDDPKGKGGEGSGAGEKPNGGAGKGGDDPDGKKKESKVKSSILGDIDYGSGDNDGGDDSAGFKTIDDIRKYMKSTLNIEGDIKEGITQAAKWKEAADEKDKIQADMNQLVSGFKDMPEPLLAGLSAWGKGDDWKSTLQGSLTSPDYSKEFNELKPDDVIRHYFPDTTFTEEQIKENDPSYKNTLSAAEKIFNRERSEFQRTREQMVNDLNKTTESFRDSVSKSFSKFTNDYPKADESVAREIKSLMEKDRVTNLFKNEDGSYKDNAFELIFFAKQGKAEVSNLVNALKERNESLQQVVNRGRDSPEHQAGRGFGDDPNTDKKKISEFEQKFFAQDPYSSK